MPLDPDAPDWDLRPDLVGRALRLVDEGVVDEHGAAGVAARLGVGERALDAAVRAEVGVDVEALAASRRVARADQLLRATDLALAEVAVAAGFASPAELDAAYAAVHRRPPGELRRPSTTGAGIELRLAHRAPLDAAGLLAFLARRAIPGVEQVGEGGYRRTYRLGADTGRLELRPVAGRPEVRLRIESTGGSLPRIAPLVARCRRLLDLDADPDAVAAVLEADPALAPLVEARPGLRLPGAFDGFELSMRAVLGQQVTVAGATTLVGRLVRLAGTPLPEPGDEGPGWLFPTADQVAAADLTTLGVPAARQRTLRALSEAVAAGSVRLDAGADPDETGARLLELPGIGPWTVAYVRLRALHDPDSLLVGDLALRKAAAAAGLPDAWPALVARAEAWRPWRGYASLHLWASAA